MTAQILKVSEIFHSLQGETSLTGLPFVFIRLTGCNLRCSYCDSEYAHDGGKDFTVSEILAEISRYECKRVLVTGGEPLLQKNTPALLKRLREQGFEVSVETNGEVPVEPIKDLARLIMDIKTPASGKAGSFFWKNLPHLKDTDEIKFVIASKQDYEWAKHILKTTHLPTREVLFSPVVTQKNNEGFSALWLAEEILKDRLDVRFQMQLHKILWGPDRRGV